MCVVCHESLVAQWLVRTSDQCAGSRRFKSCRGLRFFFSLSNAPGMMIITSFQQLKIKFTSFLSSTDCVNFMQEHSGKVMKLFEDIFGWLPLATVVNNKILVTHGGISNITDLSVIDKIDRHKVSISCTIIV